MRLCHLPALAVFMLVSVIQVQPTQACSVDTPFPVESSSVLFPVNGATGIPTNALLLVLSVRNDLVWTDASGVAVPFDSFVLPPLTAWRPLQPLAAHTTYSVTDTLGTITFTTGDGPDNSVPPTPRVFRSTPVPLGPPFAPTPCGNPSGPLCMRGRNLKVDATPGVVLWDKNQTTTDLQSGTQRVSGRNDMFGYGSAGCEFQADDQIRFSVVSVTGAWSGWNAPIPVDEPGGCACASSERHGAAVGMLLLAGLVRLRCRSKRA